jgi:type IV pilus assembly protein PilV
MRAIRQSGFTLIEVLISVLILALGVIGVAGMQLAALRSNQQSGTQSTAMQIASELADAMRANSAQMNQADDSNPYLLANSYKAVAGTPPTVPSTNCNKESCTSAQMAAFDVYEWQRKIYDRLPGGRGVICRDSAAWDTTNKKLSWACTAYAGATANNAPIVIKLGWKGRGKKADGSEVTLDTKGNPDEPPALAITVESYTK